ncbi:MAG: hypothetical protein L6R36_009492 [Xanthoria steineri]|nr:MAG: hypothetical protein L6R36_009492 [Xanthoria steineri]
MSDKTDTLSVPNLPIMESISAEIASLLQKAHIQALPDAIVTRLPFLLKRINVLAHRRSNNVRELNELKQLNAQLRRLGQASVPLRQLSSLQARRLPKVACDGNPAASKMFELGLRGANAKVEQAVEDILSLESYLGMVVDVVPVYYYEDGQD